MESYEPPITPPVRATDADSHPSKPRWNIFGIFKNRAEEQSIVAPTPEPAGHTPVATERREFAAKVTGLLRGEPTMPDTSPVPPVDAAPMSEHIPAPPIRLDQAPEAPLPFVERAKEMGRGVLKLIRRVKEDVQKADGNEHPVVPTDLEPLADADADVRAAMEELVAPIDAYRPPQRQAIVEAADGTAEADRIGEALQGGGDRDFARMTEVASPISRTMELAAAVASITAREVLDAKEKAIERVGTLRKVGLFALGAATVGGFVYTWRRVREIQKEQMAIHKEQKRFETEVRATMAEEEHRLHALQEANVEQLTPPQRQRLVQEVSDFAHAQAAEIRTVARTREVVRQPGQYPLSTRPVFEHPEAAFYEEPANRAPELAAAAATEQDPGTNGRGGIIERLAGFASGAKGGVAGAGGGPAGADAIPVASVTSAPVQNQTSSSPPLPVYRPSAQAWFWGVMLALGVVGFVVLWALRIL